MYIRSDPFALRPPSRRIHVSRGTLKEQENITKSRGGTCRDYREQDRADSRWKGRTRYKPRVRVYPAGWQLNAGPEPSLLGQLGQRRESTRGRTTSRFVHSLATATKARARSIESNAPYNKICGMRRERAVPPLFPTTVLVFLGLLGITSVSVESTLAESKVRPASSRSLILDRQDNELYREEDDAIVVEGKHLVFSHLLLLFIR